MTFDPPVALCRGYPNAWWFPEHHDTTADIAKQICAACPAQTPCAAYAISTGQKFGIWGGVSMTADSDRGTRAQLRRQLRRQTKGNK